MLHCKYIEAKELVSASVSWLILLSCLIQVGVYSQFEVLTKCRFIELKGWNIWEIKNFRPLCYGNTPELFVCHMQFLHTLQIVSLVWCLKKYVWCSPTPLFEKASATYKEFIARVPVYHWGQNYYIPFFLFWGIIFGNYYRKLYSI